MPENLAHDIVLLLRFPRDIFPDLHLGDFQATSHLARDDLDHPRLTISGKNAPEEDSDRLCNYMALTVGGVAHVRIHDD